MNEQVMVQQNKDGQSLKIVVVALCVCLVCSFIVATVSVSLRPWQIMNRQQAQQVQILKTAGVYDVNADSTRLFQRHVMVKWIDLEKGEYVADRDLRQWDPVAEARNSETSRDLNAWEDLAGIKRRGRHAPVFWVRDAQGQFKTLVLPVYGYGLWSIMYGYLGLKADMNTISGFRIYEQEETPGLGARIGDPSWLQHFSGKRLYDTGDSLREKPLITVAGKSSGSVDAKSSASPGQWPVQDIHRVDSISGATVSSNAVGAMLRFWAGRRGFGPFLKRMNEAGPAAFPLAGQGGES